MSQQHPEVDAFVQKAARWQKEMRALRAILLDCAVDEQFKWRQPCYTYDGANVAIIQVFAKHLCLMFFKGSLLKDEARLLASPGEASRAQRRFEFTSLEEVQDHEQAIRDYVAEAIQIEKEGRRVDFEAGDDLELPSELHALLKADAALATAFEALTPGRRRGYVLHFSSAKKAETRVARFERAREKILQGKGLQER